MTAPGIDHRLEDERTRKRIREALDETLFVEAGAGTGKTRALVERVVALVLAGTRIERIVAITFTERAAAELRERVRRELEQARATQPDHGEAIERALRSLDRAQISTIHAFAHALLRSFAAEAGIDPAFDVQDEVLAGRRFQERWRTYLDDLGEDANALQVVDRVLSLGLSTHDLSLLAKELGGGVDLASRLEERPVLVPTPMWPDVDRMEERLRALPLDVAPEGDTLRTKVEGLLELVADLQRPGADREAVLASGASIIEKPIGAVGNKGTWGDALTAVRESAEEVRERLADLLGVCRAEALSQLLPLIVRFVREDERVRGREGALTFDDLILQVRNLMRGNRGAAESLRERYDALLIDEFQDTDPLQVEIALAFATEPQTGRIEAGRLFLVGDPKQSIYRFRRADMAVYAETQNRIVKNGGVALPLALNGRSRQVVLDWVNAVFASAIGDGTDPHVQPPYHAIHPERPDVSLAGAGVAWMGGVVEGQYARVVRQMEADAVAAQCRTVLAEGWQVYDRDLGVVRAARYGDIAILIPRRTILTALERALADAGVPYRVEGGSLIYRTQEVRDIINCLTAIDDPADQVAVVGALRSPAFACSDVDLARHRAAGGRFEYLARDAETREGPVADALRVLRRYHVERHEKSIAALAEAFAAERGLVETGILDRGDRNSFRRVRFVVEQARAFEAAGPESLRAFVQWLESRSGEAIRDNEGAGADDDEDAVRVLTVHAAKGLEFPIVFMAGLGAAPGYRGDVFTADRTGQRVAVSIGARSRRSRFELGPVTELVALEKEHEEAEFRRVLYVAATRARDHLAVFLYHTPRAGHCAARRLMEAGACEHANELQAPSSAGGVAAAPFAGLTVDLSDVDEEQLAPARAALIARAQTVKYTSATAIARRATTPGETREEKPEAADESEPWARGRGGTRLGRAVHAAIQSLPLDASDDEIGAFARAQAVAEAIPERAGDVSRLVRWVLRESGAAARARQARRSLREVPFAVQEDGTVLEGFVDLLIETDGGMEVVDWKTDQIDPDEVESRLRDYELQAGLYVLGIEAATQRKVTALTYVFASARREVSPGDPAVLAAAARESLRAQP